MLLFFLRHADPTYEPDDITPLGKKQADALAQRLYKSGINKIYSSSSVRAMKTAASTARLVHKDITPLDFAREDLLWRDLTVTNDAGKRVWCFFDKDFVEFFQTAEIRKLGSKWYEHYAFTSSNYKSAMERIDAESDKFIESLGYRHDRERGGYIPVKPNNDRIAFFAHHGFGMAFLSSILDIPFPLMSTHFEISHTGMTVIEFCDKASFVVPRVLQMSNDSHLYRFGLSTKYNNYVEF